MKRHELIEITRHSRRYDRKTGKFHITIRYKTKTDITDRTVAVAEAFGLGISDSQEHVLYDDVEFKVGSRDVVYVTGDSGLEKVCSWTRLSRI